MKDVLKEIVKSVPDYKVFKTVDELDESSKELAKRYSNEVSLLEVGRSRDNNPIYCLKIGNGEKSALLYAFPHPNEPIGSLVLDYLSEKLASSKELRDVFDFTWYIIKVADPDGAKLNEGWFKGPFNPLNYALNFYRPAGNQQVEWTFPIKYKTLDFNSPIPETKALMNIMEEAKPDFIYSLHNAGFGGVYFYITDEAPLLYPIFEKAYKDLNLPASLGEPEMPYAVKLADAVYKMPTTEDTYDYYEKYSDKDPAEIIKSGTASYGYARRFNDKIFELVCEVPYYYDPRIEDLSSVDKIRRDLVLKNIDTMQHNYEDLENIYNTVKNKLIVKTPMQQAIDYFLDSAKKSIPAEKKWAQQAKELGRKATVAEEFDNELVSKFYRMLIWGMFRRMLLINYEASKDMDLKSAADDVYQKLQSLNEKLEKGLNYTVIPIQKLVKVQLMAGLYSALHVKEGCK
ncbi:MAG: hypothetical protein DRP50_00815 [Thermotoga sp.]|nr:MAG: hypothetical protein DRP50_00815 [Thermotoga sp.]